MEEDVWALREFARSGSPMIVCQGPQTCAQIDCHIKHVLGVPVILQEHGTVWRACGSSTRRDER